MTRPGAAWLLPRSGDWNLPGDLSVRACRAGLDPGAGLAFGLSGVSLLPASGLAQSLGSLAQSKTWGRAGEGERDGGGE